MSNFFRSMGRSTRPKKSPTLPNADFAQQQQYFPTQQQASISHDGAFGPNGKALYLCSPFVRSALVKGSFKTIVTLPKYVDPREWVAVNRESTVIENLLYRLTSVSLTHAQ